ncbi:HEAT repeat domain-containing protein [Corallococcus sp. M34]|uniref:HEAT repeat domain-containing protein n=1 Tax=Citreicoccus inhibens TaxID=2849499 RepID=UPI001C21BFF3|nr:HEAT repeat domain-containing protein [Citreicoccus inhibens]
MKTAAKDGHTRVPAWLVCAVLALGLACSRHTWKRGDDVMSWEGCCEDAEECLALLQDVDGPDTEERMLPEAQQCAAWKLGRLGEPVIPQLIALLQHPERRVRGGAAQALADMREKAKGAVPALLAAYEREPRGMALHALTLIDDASAGPVIARHLEESPLPMLEQLGPKLAPVLLDVLENPESSWAALVRVRYVLSRRSYRYAETFVPRLRALLARELAEPTLRRPPGTSCPAVPLPSCEAIYDGCTPRAAYVVSVLGAAGKRGVAAVPEVVQALQRADVRLAPVALQALVAFDSPAAVPAVLEQLARAECQGRALTSLASLGPVARPAATAPLLHLLATGEEGWTRARAAAALGRLGDPAALDALRQAASSSHSEVAGAAVRALGRVAFRPHAEEVLALLQKVAESHSSPVVRSNAQRSIQILKPAPARQGSASPRSCEALRRMGSEEWPVDESGISLVLHTMEDKVAPANGPCVGVPGADSAAVLEPMGDACLVGHDAGEFGGSLEVHEKGRVTVLEAPDSNPLFVVRVHGALVVAEGVMHLYGGDGRLVRIDASKAGWRATPWVELPGAPMAHALNAAGDLVVATMNQRLDELVCGRVDGSADTYVLRVTEDGRLSPEK